MFHFKIFSFEKQKDGKSTKGKIYFLEAEKEL
jgi:hypothetical protein